MQFIYPLRYDDANEQTIGLMWEQEFLTQVNDFESDEIVVYRRASQSLEDELDVRLKSRHSAVLHNFHNTDQFLNLVEHYDGQCSIQAMVGICGRGLCWSCRDFFIWTDELHRSTLYQRCRLSPISYFG